MKCPNCGEELTDGAVMCGYCGMVLLDEPAAQPEKAAEAPVSEPAVLWESAPAEQSPESRQPEAQTFEMPDFSQPETPAYEAPQAQPYRPYQEPAADYRQPYAPEYSRQEPASAGYRQPEEPAGKGGKSAVAGEIGAVVLNYLKSLGGLIRWYVESLLKPDKTPLLSKTGGFEWVPIVVCNTLFFALALTVNLKQSFDTEGIFAVTVPFGKTFGANLLIGLVYYLLALGLGLADALFLRKSKESFGVILNHLTVVAFPMTALLLINLILGLINLFVPVILFSVGAIAVLTARANMMKKLCGTPDIPLIDASVINGVALLVSSLIGYGLYQDIAQSIGYLI